ncbi:hypothetical protein [Rhodopseudomonas palustris]|jgi:hypothetical protein|uniref:Tail tubular protein A n=2 Tax=Rhodopseudomonas palustris TaxID=1076 RepID=A0A323UPJ0_RHOPL|nr:hypothetical protein [Rhodopseudomonas palustris]PZA13953.1 hypothetical protein DNX69_00550 [Rhodopseudomonas palustris]UYO52500.1 hypothetical protein KQX61_18150 [Rhodopseudomonas palustris]
MDTTALAPMSEIEAINDMLSLISESPVASLEEASRVADAQTAMQLLRRESRTVQTHGWDWNTEHDLVLSPDMDGNIILPKNTIKVDPTDGDIDCVNRGGRLWDRTNKTFNIGKPISLTITFVLPFEELPETARRYISMAAGRKFENRMIGDGNSHQINELDVLKAWSILLQEECDNSESNVVRQSTTVRRIAHGRFR